MSTHEEATRPPGRTSAGGRAADAVVARLDLIVYVVRCAGKAGAAFDQLLD